MGLLPVAAFTVGLLVVYSLSSVFCGLVLRSVFHRAVAVTAKFKRKVTTGKSDVLCPCIFKKYSTVQFTMAITVASVAFFLMACVTYGASMTLLLATCYDCSKRKLRADNWFHVAYILLLYGAYAFMLVTHFERLRLTFRNSAYKLPIWAPNILYADVFVGGLLMAAQFALSRPSPIASAICMTFLGLLYVASGCVLVGAFFKKTMNVAESIKENERKLTESAVRVTVSVTVSLLTSTFAAAFRVISLSVCPMCLLWLFLRNTILAVDICVNCFCLLCTFRSAERHYQLVFGRLHALFLARVSKRRDAAIQVLPVAAISLQRLNLQETS